MFFTSDERLICKTMSPEECNFLRKIAPSYEAYMTANRNTLLTRFYGCHSVSLYGKMYYFVVMANLFADTQVRSNLSPLANWNGNLMITCLLLGRASPIRYQGVLGRS